ncbi:hypothetical protein ACFQI7_30285 [Paenibacillus allorhizosphaerae]|uniref:Aminoglycoside phosphotransferase domain-containing protein n=1 Tax=Paenibacillus allorhizosphaerae TaxID=2849866 RepID=A0ABM8VHI4_9BACL|nr:hypothetical protein [Paenibacillus allorhizosphaerae]CAG7640345.1 hypothetical protein PAECIP111802_02638 [Paenibacillus allorhizosphaerae]
MDKLPKTSNVRVEAEAIHRLVVSFRITCSIPVPNLNGELVTSVVIECEEVHCSVLKWILGDTMSKIDFASREMVSALGMRIAYLHQFSRNFIATEEFQILENAFSLVTARMKGLSKSFESWGFIHESICGYVNIYQV